MLVAATMQLTTRVASVAMATLFTVTTTGLRTTLWSMPRMVVAPLPLGGQVAMFARDAKLPSTTNIICVLFVCGMNMICCDD